MQINIFNIKQVTKLEPHEILQAVRKIKDFISAGKYEEAAYKIWILQPLLRNTSVGVRGKVLHFDMLTQCKQTLSFQ